MNKKEKALFAGGCFWCIQKPFDEIPGVIETTVGYTGGVEENPTYQDVCSGSTGHIEAIQVTYDPIRISYEQLLKVYWRNIDPMQKEGQFCDIGAQYQPVIFYLTEEQKDLAEKSKKEVQSDCVVEILPANTFYPAEEYHQKYYKKNKAQYDRYHAGSGRAERLKELWG